MPTDWDLEAWREVAQIPVPAMVLDDETIEVDAGSIRCAMGLIDALAAALTEARAGWSDNGKALADALLKLAEERTLVRHLGNANSQLIDLLAAEREKLAVARTELTAERALADTATTVLAAAIRSFVWLDKPSSTCLWCFDVMAFSDDGVGVLRHKDDCIKTRAVEVLARYLAARQPQPAARSWLLGEER